MSACIVPLRYCYIELYWPMDGLRVRESVVPACRYFVSVNDTFMNGCKSREE